MRRHGDKITYVLIAFAVCLILMALSTYKTTRMANTILYTSVAISLLAENIPKVVEIPVHCVLIVLPLRSLLHQGSPATP